jgi:transcriptional regulator
MSYLPSHFTSKNWESVKTFIELFPLATLISLHDQEIFTSHIPFIIFDNKLVGHINKENPQFQHIHKSRVELIFHAGDAYISPSEFETDELPTFNFAKVHLKGKANFIEEPKMVESLIAMTNQLDFNFKLESNHPKIPALKHFIQGLEVSIDEFHGRFKMSQDKTESHFNKAKTLLKKSQEKRLNLFLNTLSQ